MSRFHILSLLTVVVYPYLLYIILFGTHRGVFSFLFLPGDSASITVCFHSGYRKNGDTLEEQPCQSRVVLNAQADLD